MVMLWLNKCSVISSKNEIKIFNVGAFFSFAYSVDSKYFSKFHHAGKFGKF